MTSRQTWILLFVFTLMTQCVASMYYNRKPFVPPKRDPSIHLYMDEEPPEIIIPKYGPSPRVVIYPLTPSEMEELYTKLLKKRNNKFQEFPLYRPGDILKSNLNLYDGKKCCGGSGNKWASYGTSGGHKHNELTKPVFQLGHGYPSNQDQEYRSNSDVKPVVEHIEGDLKYDFRTNTYSF